MVKSSHPPEVHRKAHRTSSEKSKSESRTTADARFKNSWNLANHIAVSPKTYLHCSARLAFPDTSRLRSTFFVQSIASGVLLSLHILHGG